MQQPNLTVRCVAMGPVATRIASCCRGCTLLWVQRPTSTVSCVALGAASLNQLAKNLTCEWAAEGIRVNSVAPWYTATPLANAVLKDEEFKKGVLERTPIGRIADVDEVAGAAPSPLQASCLWSMVYYI